MKHFLIFALAIVLSSLGSIAQMPPDSCFKMICPDEEPGEGGSDFYSNPDSVLVDSCYGSANFGVAYAYKYFEFHLETVASDGYPFGNLITLNTPYSVNDMTSSYDNAKQKYSQIDPDFKFSIIRPSYGEVLGGQAESEHMIRPCFAIVFDNYVPIKEAKQLLFAIFEGYVESKSIAYASRAGVAVSVTENDEQNSEITIYPNPATEIITIAGICNSQKYEIFDILGNRLTSGEFTGSVDISNYQMGVYYIQINNKRIKFIKE